MIDGRKKMKRVLYVPILLVLLMAAGVATAMTSASYTIPWYASMTGSGGSMSSANYSLDFTVGQTVIGNSGSTNYTAGLGYWYGASPGSRIYLPLVLRSL
jgi:hypothetical protein